MLQRLVVFTCAALLAQPVLADAQQPAQNPSAGKPVAAPVQLQVVIARYRNEKRVASAPYTLAVKVNTAPVGAQVRIGSQIPISTMINDKPTVTFRDIGTGIDARVNTLDDGRFEVTLNIDETAFYGESQEPIKLQATAPAPVLRSYRASNTMHLRDGQTAQFTAGTDPITGDTIRVDVTLTATK